MSSRELSPEWVLSSFIPPIAAPQHEINELIVVARRLWPRVQAHAHREQPGKNSDEALDFASEVWEGVLRSVAKTIQRSNGRNWRIKNMEAYLFGAFTISCACRSVAQASASPTLCTGRPIICAASVSFGTR